MVLELSCSRGQSLIGGEGERGSYQHLQERVVRLAKVGLDLANLGRVLLERKKW